MGWFEGWRERRHQKLIDKARQDLVTGAIRSNPALPGRHEDDARRLAELGPMALDASERDVVAIGKRLNSEGGNSLMVAVLERADALSLQAGYTVLRGIEKAWDGIGEWRG